MRNPSCRLSLVNSWPLSSLEATYEESKRRHPPLGGLLASGLEATYEESKQGLGGLRRLEEDQAGVDTLEDLGRFALGHYLVHLTLTYGQRLEATYEESKPKCRWRLVRSRPGWRAMRGGGPALDGQADGLGPAPDLEGDHGASLNGLLGPTIWPGPPGPEPGPGG